MKYNYFEIPTQVKFWDGRYIGGIAYRDEIICGCCGGIFGISDIYELAPSKWDNGFDYIYRRGEWVKLDSDRGDFFGTYIFTSIAMRTLFDFWRLLHWQEEITRKKEREERFKNEKASLKNLTIMIERDTEDIRRKWEEEEQKAEKLRQEIIDRLGGNK